MRILFTLFFFSAVFAQAEYRAYILEITNQKTQESRTVRTTFPPEAYQRLYPLAAGEKAVIASTWICKGNTNQFRLPCSKVQN